MQRAEGLRLYQVIRHGNDAEFDELGADGDDTMFLVLARNHRRAALLADYAIRDYFPDTKLDRWCHTVFELGVSHPLLGSADSPECLLLGPVVQGYGGAFQGWPTWNRYEESGPWIVQGECPSCGFDLKLADTEVTCPKCGWDRIGASNAMP